MRARLLAGLSVLVASVLIVGCGDSGSGDRLAAGPAPAGSRFRPQIVNGVLTTDFPTTGTLLFGSSASTASGICSGTLIGCQTFLTAGHCVCDTTGVDCQGAGAPDPANYFVFLQHGGIFSVQKVALRPDFNFPVGDVAVLTLAAPVTGIAPTPINTTEPPVPGTAGVIAGFGRTGGSNQDFGLKRDGDVTTTACTGGISNSTSVCWNFNNPLGAPGSNSNTCNGDSGGPLFIDFGAGPRVAGVTSGGSSSNCLPTDNSFDANVYSYSSWIQTEAGADLANTTCGNIPQVGRPGTNVSSFSGDLSSANPIGTHSFEVPAGTTLLRVTMNAMTDFDLYLKAGSPPTTADFDCRQDGSNEYGACAFAAPAGGTWYAMVQRYAGTGSYQLTVTRFGVDCSDPSNNGQPCDDNNACTSNDACASGQCTGTQVLNGTACDDGDACTQSDTCQAGACVGDARPSTSCQGPFVSNAGSFHLQEPAVSPSNLSWLWMKGTAIDRSAFGDPTNTTTYTLCVYDQTAGSDALVIDTRIPPGGTCGNKPCWSPTNRGFRYTDRSASNGGINSIQLKSGVDGNSSIVVKGKGSGLGLPALPLHEDPTVTVQLHNALACWEARYTTDIKSSVSEFRARPGG